MKKEQLDILIDTADELLFRLTKRNLTESDPLEKSILLRHIRSTEAELRRLQHARARVEVGYSNLIQSLDEILL